MILSWLLLFFCAAQNVLAVQPNYMMPIFHPKTRTETDAQMDSPKHAMPVFPGRAESDADLEEERQSFPPMINHGGPVLASPVVYLIWYGKWSCSDKNIITNFVSNLGRTAWWAMNNAYGVGSISLRGTASDPYSQGTTLTNVFGVVQNAFNRGWLPQNPNAIYLVLSSSDVTTTDGFCTIYCGYHNFNGNIKYGFIGVPPPGCPCSAQQISPNGNAGVDAAVNVIAHELTEAATDPNLNAWFNTRGEENADVCNFNFLNVNRLQNGASYNVVVGGLKYLIQSNFNLLTKTCAMS